MSTSASSIFPRIIRHSPASYSSSGFLHWLSSVNQEIWLVLSILVLAGLLNFIVDAQRMVLGFYALPTLFAAYTYGRRHAVLTAFATAFVVGLMMYLRPTPLSRRLISIPIDEKWFDVTVWAGTLVVTAYAMGTLYERREAHIRELRETYYGVLLILQGLVCSDKQSQYHSERVSIYATAIARAAGLRADQIEDIRTAALLHEIGSMEAVRPVLLRAANFAQDEAPHHHNGRGSAASGSSHAIGGSLRRVLPIIAEFHALESGPATAAYAQSNMPEVHILKVADVYDSLTSDRPYRSAISPFDARTVIKNGSGTDFERHAVEGFLRAFDRRQLDVPELRL